MAEKLIQSSLAGGEIGPELWGRVDQDLYYIGARTQKNMITRQYGGSANRPGLKYLAPARYPDKKARLIKFQFNEIQAYQLEFGDFYMRVIKDNGHVLEAAKNITAATQANPGVITSAGHGFSNGDDVYVQNVGGMVELNARFFRVAGVTANTFQLTDYHGNNVDTTTYTAYTSGGTVARVYTVATPWPEAKLFDLNYAQNKDILTIATDEYYPRDITRTAHDAWTVTQFDNKEGPFADINGTATTVYASAATGTGVTLTASAALFNANMVGDLFYIEQRPDDTTARWEVGKSITSGNVRRAGFHYYSAANTATSGSYRPDWTEGSSRDGDPGVTWNYLHSGFGIVKITGFTSSTVVTVDVINRLPDNVVGVGGATPNWARQAWSADYGYPQALAYHKRRYIFGGSKNFPNDLWMSGTGLRTFFGKSNPILADEVIRLSLDTVEVNAVRHLLPFSDLIALTSASEQLVNGPDDVLSAVDLPSAKVQGYTGASRVRPLIIGDTAIFIESTGNVVRSLRYNLDSDSFGGIDLTARSPHLFRNREIVDWDFQRRPFSVVWTILDNGQLLGFTFMDEQRVYAWHRHETDGIFESVSCLREGKETSAYFIVKRTINGLTERYIEKMASREFSLIEDAYFVDSGLTYDGRNTTATTMTLSGGTTWDTPEVLTLTASTAQFTAADVGNQIVFWDGDDAIRLDISAFTSSTVVSVVPTQLVPAGFRNVARTDWRFGRTLLRGLFHLEGKAVSVLADGNVVDGITVSGGRITLPYASSVVHVGLPYVADLETLELAGPQGAILTDDYNIPLVRILVQETVGGLYGLDGFDEEKMVPVFQREDDFSYDLPVPAETHTIEVVPNTSWSSRGRIAMRQKDPLPMTINAIRPEVVLGSR